MSRTSSILTLTALAALGTTCLVPTDASARGGFGGGFHGGFGGGFHGSFGGFRASSGGGFHSSSGGRSFHAPAFHSFSNRSRVLRHNTPNPVSTSRGTSQPTHSTSATVSSTGTASSGRNQTVTFTGSCSHRCSPQGTSGSTPNPGVVSTPPKIVSSPGIQTTPVSATGCRNARDCMPAVTFAPVPTPPAVAVPSPPRIVTNGGTAAPMSPDQPRGRKQLSTPSKTASCTFDAGTVTQQVVGGLTLTQPGGAPFNSLGNLGGLTPAQVGPAVTNIGPLVQTTTPQGTVVATLPTGGPSAQAAVTISLSTQFLKDLLANGFTPANGFSAAQVTSIAAADAKVVLTSFDTTSPHLKCTVVQSPSNNGSGSNNGNGSKNGNGGSGNGNGGGGNSGGDTTTAGNGAGSADTTGTGTSDTGNNNASTGNAGAQDATASLLAIALSWNTAGDWVVHKAATLDDAGNVSLTTCNGQYGACNLSTANVTPAAYGCLVVARGTNDPTRLAAGVGGNVDQARDQAMARLANTADQGEVVFFGCNG